MVGVSQRHKPGSNQCQNHDIKWTGLGRHKPVDLGSEGGQQNGVKYSWVKYSNSRTKSVDLAAWYPFMWILQ